MSFTTTTRRNQPPKTKMVLLRSLIGLIVFPYVVSMLDPQSLLVNARAVPVTTELQPCYTVSKVENETTGLGLTDFKGKQKAVDDDSENNFSSSSKPVVGNSQKKHKRRRTSATSQVIREKQQSRRITIDDQQSQPQQYDGSSIAGPSRRRTVSAKSSNDDNAPGSRWGQTATYLPNYEVVLFVGGQTNKKGDITNEVYALDVSLLQNGDQKTNTTASSSSSSAKSNKSKWIKLDNTGLPPHAFAAATITEGTEYRVKGSPGNETLWLVGGVTADCHKDAPLYYWNAPNGKLEQGKWSSLTADNAPLRRRGAKAIQVPSDLGISNNNNSSSSNNTTSDQQRLSLADGAAVMVVGGFADETVCYSGKPNDTRTDYQGIDIWYDTVSNKTINDNNNNNEDGHHTVHNTTVRSLSLDPRMKRFLLVDYATVVLPGIKSDEPNKLSISDRVLFLGGKDKTGQMAPFHYFWVLELQTGNWERWESAGDIPTGRMGHSAVLTPEGKIVIHGGYLQDPSTPKTDIQPTDEVFVLDPNITPANWTKAALSSESEKPPARAYHSSVMAGDVMIVAFGHQGKPSDDQNHDVDKDSVVRFLDMSNPHDGWAWRDSLEGVAASRNSATQQQQQPQQQPKPEQGQQQQPQNLAPVPPPAPAPAPAPASPSTDSSANADSAPASAHPEGGSTPSNGESNPKDSPPASSPPSQSSSSPSSSSQDGTTSDNAASSNGVAANPTGEGDKQGTSTNNADSDSQVGQAAAPAPNSSKSEPGVASSPNSSPAVSSSAPRFPSSSASPPPVASPPASNSAAKKGAIAGGLLGAAAAAIAVAIGGVYAYRKRRESQAFRLGQDSVRRDSDGRMDGLVRSTSTSRGPPVSSLWLHQPAAWASAAGRSLKRVTSSATVFPSSSKEHQNGLSHEGRLETGHAGFSTFAGIPNANTTAAAAAAVVGGIESPISELMGTSAYVLSNERRGAVYEGSPYTTPPQGSFRVLGNVRKSSRRHQFDIDQTDLTAIPSRGMPSSSPPIPDELIVSMVDTPKLHRAVTYSSTCTSLAVDPALSTYTNTRNNRSSESLASSIGSASHLSYPYLSAMHRASLANLSSTHTSDNEESLRGHSHSRRERVVVGGVPPSTATNSPFSTTRSHTDESPTISTTSAQMDEMMAKQLAWELSWSSSNQVLDQRTINSRQQQTGVEVIVQLEEEDEEEHQPEMEDQLSCSAWTNPHSRARSESVPSLSDHGSESDISSELPSDFYHGHHRDNDQEQVMVSSKQETREIIYATPKPPVFRRDHEMISSPLFPWSNAPNSSSLMKSISTPQQVKLPTMRSDRLVRESRLR